MNTTISERVVQSVAETTNSDTLDLPQLYNAIDPDALNALIDQMADGEVSFSYAGHKVTVNNDGSIRLD